MTLLAALCLRTGLLPTAVQGTGWGFDDPEALVGDFDEPLSEQFPCESTWEEPPEVVLQDSQVPGWAGARWVEWAGALRHGVSGGFARTARQASGSAVCPGHPFSGPPRPVGILIVSPLPL